MIIDRNLRNTFFTTFALQPVVAKKVPLYLSKTLNIDLSLSVGPHIRVTMSVPYNKRLIQEAASLDEVFPPNLNPAGKRQLQR